ncbi:MAG: hypothetical protein HYY04_00475 [Chloroflexi bacterium]|nr:hypothetical protein [Chloroflexota bacterium]
MREGIAPYTRYVRAERDRIETPRAALASIRFSKCHHFDQSPDSTSPPISP